MTDAQTHTRPVAIPIAPWLLDHRFEGAAILPAVEMLQILARAVQSRKPGAAITFLQRASFDRFLRIEAGATVINAKWTLAVAENGEIEASISTAAKVGSAGVTRIIKHATVFFPQSAPLVNKIPEPVLAAPHISGFKVPASRLYAELIPFGPAFQSVQETVLLTESSAVTRVLALDEPKAEGPLGSPFPFDGSLHAACAWAQRYCGIIAFPIGFAKRVIIQPIATGETVTCAALPVSVHGGAITFDIWLWDDSGRLREEIRGVVMRDVTAGRLSPPAWVRCEATVRLA